MNTITKVLFVILLLIKSFNVDAAIYTASATGDLDNGTVTLTSTQTSPVTYLRQIAVNFASAPEAAETITVTAMSSAGASYDVVLSKATTVAAATTAVTFIIGTPVQIDNTHQVKVFVTNASQSVGEVNDDPVVFISALFDTVAPTGSEGIIVLRDGVLLSSTRYPTVLDEAVALTQWNRVNFTGGGVVCTNNAAQSRTDCTVSDQYYATVQDETTPLTQRQKINFTGGGVSCADNGGTTTTDCTIGNQYYATVQEEGAPVTQRLVLNFAGTYITCVDDTSRTTCTVTTPSYQTVQDEGTPLTVRPVLNFVGAGVTCTDNAGNGSTDCTIP